MKRKLFKAYFLIRRKISSRLFYFIERVFVFAYSHKINKVNYRLKHYYFEPIEVQLGQNISNRQDELQRLTEAYRKNELNNFIKSTIKLERNKAYRWNAFYPLFSLLSEQGLLHDFESNVVKKIAIEYVLNWIDEYLYKGRANPFCWYDMADAYRIILLHKIMLLYNNDIDEKSKSIIQYAIYIHEYFILKDELLQRGNHRIFQILARLSIHTLRENHDFLEIERERVINLFYSQFSKEGFHVEHSPEYHLWANCIFLHIIKYYNLNKLEKQISLVTERSNLFFTPDGNIPLIGDSGLDNLESYKKQIYQNKPSYGTTISNDYVISISQKVGWYFISLNSSNSMIHKHRDSSTFELFIFGKKILTDCGKYSYTKSEFNKLIRAEESHNISYIKKEPSIFSTQTYKLVSHEKKNNIEIISIQAGSKNMIHTRSFIHNFIDHLIVVDIIDEQNENLFTNLNLVNGDTYKLEQSEENQAVYFSNEMDIEISFHNIHSSNTKKTNLSKFYGELYEDISLQACSKNNMIITSVCSGKKNRIKDNLKNNFLLELDNENIIISANGTCWVVK